MSENNNNLIKLFHLDHDTSNPNENKGDNSINHIFDINYIHNLKEDVNNNIVELNTLNKEENKDLCFREKIISSNFQEFTDKKQKKENMLEKKSEMQLIKTIFPSFPNLQSSNSLNLTIKSDISEISKSSSNSFLNRKRSINNTNHFPNLSGSRSIDNYEYIGKIDEGAYGIVYKAKDKLTGDIVAIKKVKLGKEKDGFPITSIREINILMNFHQENIMNIKEVVYGTTTDKIFCVMEYADFELKALLSDAYYIDSKTNTKQKRIFNLSQIKNIFFQLLNGVDFIHTNWIIHRDLKTSNLLYTKKGILKIADFGLARKYGNPIKPYTPLVVTLWYRAPELLLNIDKYSTAIDMWSCGCILAELFLCEPLFQGRDEIDQLHKIFKIMGTPEEKNWKGWLHLPNAKRINFGNTKYNEILREKFPKFSYEDDFVLTDKGYDLLKKLLIYDPERRLSAEEALRHPWFNENPKICDNEKMPDLNNVVIAKDKIKGYKAKLRSLNEEQIKQREKLHNEERYEAKLMEEIEKEEGNKIKEGINEIV